MNIKPGDPIKYVATSNHNGLCVAVSNTHATFAYGVNGWLAKSPNTVPLDQVVGTPEVGEPSVYVTKTTVHGYVQHVYPKSLAVAKEIGETAACLVPTVAVVWQ